MRRPSVQHLGLVLALALTGLVLAPGASASTPQDTITATGSSAPLSPPIVTKFGDVALSGLDVTAQSGTSGQNPSGTASFSLGELTFSGLVSCLAVTGPDSGAGTTAVATTAVLRFQDSASGFFFTMQLVDNGGNGADTIAFASGQAPGPGCSVTEPIGTPETGTLTAGRAVVIDAPVVPTSIGQCLGGGWRNYPQFSNLGLCVRFVETGK